MSESILNNIGNGSVSAGDYALVLASAIVLGLGIAWTFTRGTSHTKGFAVMLALLPAIAATIVLMVSGSLGASVAVAGTFSLVRFRSAAGTAREIGMLLEKAYRGELVSPAASRQMLDILLAQQLNGKLPFFLDCEVAHKTGEDDGITHDAGIIFAPKPFIVCLFSNNTDVPPFERLMQDIARELYEMNQ